MEVIELLPGVQDFLNQCPKTGEGVHRWIFHAALLLQRANVPVTAIPALISAATAECGRGLQPNEIERAIGSSRNHLLGNNVARRAPKWPQPNNEQIEAIAREGAGLGELKRLSPTKWSDGKPHSEELIDVLFPGNPLLCVGQSKYRFATMLREEWRGRLATREFIVPSPMSKAKGITQAGKPSAHTLNNTGPRLFIVIEFDNGTFDEHASILLHLAQLGALVMVVHSGSKSLHGWFHVQGQSESKVKKFFCYAASLGADTQLWIRSQFVRLPDGRRDTGKRQEVVYFDPEILKGKL